MAKASPIESARAKLNWAHLHLNTFDTELRLWQEKLLAKGNLVRIRMQPEPKPRDKHAWVGIVEKIPPVPHRFALIAGDVVHNLRSALDHTTWAMAERANADRGRDTRTQFPIVTDPSEWGKWPMTRWTDFLTDVDIATLERLQPYHTANPPEDHPLVWLDGLNNRDKHREINVVASAPDFLIARFEPIRDCVVKNESSLSAALKVGAPALWVSFVPTGPHPEVYMEPHFVPTVAIYEGPDRSGLAKYVLPNLKCAVARVIRILEKVLDRRG